MTFKAAIIPLGLILSAFLLSCQDAAPSQEETLEKTATAEQAIASPPKIAPQYTQTIKGLKSRPALQAAFQSIESHRAENIKTLIELTEIPSPPFGEDKRATRIAELFRGLGLNDVSIDEVGNVIARRAGTIGDKTIAMAAHIDTVFPVETDVKVRQKGDTYYAPGIGDNTRGVVLMLSLIKAMGEHNIQTEADLLFIGNVGEEGLGDLRGVKHLYREGAPVIDALIAVDSGDIDRLIYGGVGSLRYRVTYQGRGGHSWGAFGSANPHHALGRASVNSGH